MTRVAFYGRNGRRFAASATHVNAGLAANRFVRAKAEIHSFADARDFLDGAGEKQIASNVTVVVRERDRNDNPTAIAIRLYATDILTYYSDETFTFSNGGYYTPTTSCRAQQFGPKDYRFGHHKLKFYANGHAEDPALRLPVFRPENPA